MYGEGGVSRYWSLVGEILVSSYEGELLVNQSLCAEYEGTIQVLYVGQV